VLGVASYARGIPYTPHVQAYIALDVALDLYAEEDRHERYRRLARSVWETGSRHFEPLLPEPDRSNVLTAFRLDGRDSDELLDTARSRGFVLYAGQGPLKSEIFRVANMGVALDEALIKRMFATIGQR
jgi:2-aminoethylphosphonate-pyruvate transaminase